MNRLKEIRQLKGVMQKTVAELAGVSHPFIHDLENGNRKARPETWEKIALALDCTVDELTGEDDIQMDATERKLDALMKRMANAKRLVELGIYSPAEYVEQTAKIQKKINAIQAETLQAVSNG